MRSCVRWMPDSADSTGYGTRMRSARSLPVGTASPSDAPANCHTPLRFFQSLRVSCGRGYSGSAWFGPTLSVHGVLMGGVLACHPESPPGGGGGGAGDGAAIAATGRASSPAVTAAVRPRLCQRERVRVTGRASMRASCAVGSRSRRG